jgi:hypothetical protein
VTVPDTIGSLTLRDDAAARRATERLKAATRAEYLFAEDTFAAVYGDGNGKRVTVFGTTGLRWSPDADVVYEISRLTEQYALTEVQTVPSDARGEHRRCAVGDDDGTGVVVCSWADHGSLGTGVFTRLDIADSSDLLSELRANLITRRN